MARLIDRLRTEHHVRVGRALYDQASADSVADLMDHAVPIVCDNVASLWANQDLNVLFSDMPPLAPPFQVFWMEAREPVRDASRIFDSWGALCCVRDIESPSKWQGFDLRETESTDALRAHGIRWLLNWTVFGELHGRARAAVLGVEGATNLWGPICGMVIRVAPDGSFVPDPLAKRGMTRSELDTAMRYGLRYGGQAQNEFVVERLVDFGAGHEQLEMACMTAASSYLRILVYALGLMNCKNVSAVNVNPPPKLAAKRERKYGKPLVRYKVLTVGPHNTTRREGVSVEEGSELHRALHVCRGHFRTYTPEAPLFGKFTGTYWVAAHVRGTKSEGMVVKTYDVRDRAHEEIA